MQDSRMHIELQREYKLHDCALTTIAFKLRPEEDCDFEVLIKFDYVYA